MPHFLEADLFILPPDYVFSGADSDDEDEPQSMNHLSSRQLSVSTEVVLRTAYLKSEFSKSENGDVRVLKAESPPSKKESSSG